MVAALTVATAIHSERGAAEDDADGETGAEPAADDGAATEPLVRSRPRVCGAARV